MTADIEITFIDGTKEVVPKVGRAVIEDSVLHLRTDRMTLSGDRHLGSYPIANIRKWRYMNE